MWIALLVAAFVLWLIYRKRHFSFFKDLGIPGPKPSLFFGNLVEFSNKTPLKSIEEWFQKYGKVVGYYFGTHPVLLVADPDLLKKIQISEFHKFINRPDIFRPRTPQNRNEDFTQHLVALRDKRWKEVRSILTPSFTVSKMKQMAPIMNSAIDSLINNVEKNSSKGKSFDIYPLYQGLTMDVIGRTAFGIQSDAQNDPNDPMLRSSKVLLSGEIKGNKLFIVAASFRSFSTFWLRVSRLRLKLKNEGINPFKEMIETVKNIINIRRNDKTSQRPDLLQSMIDAKIDDSSTITSEDLTADADSEDKKSKSVSSGKLFRRMTDNDIVDNSVLFFLAAYETTSTALAFTTHFLIHYPEAQERIREEVQNLLATEGVLDYYAVSKLQYLDQVLQESLRLYPPVYLFVSRECAEDVKIGNFEIKKGMAIQVPAYHIQRDKEIWGPDADEFKPERFAAENKSQIHPMAFQTFGAGPRNCVGMRFAYMEAKLALARLLSKYRFEACPETDKLDLTLKISAAAINPKNGVWTRAVPLS